MKTLRVARHTDNLGEIEEFYTNIIGLENLGGFKNHNGYDGVFLGKKDLNWHIEFTSSNNKAVHKEDEDDFLVFYCESSDEYNTYFNRIKENEITTIQTLNTYWNENGICIKDPDGFKIIIRKPLSKTINTSA